MRANLAAEVFRYQEASAQVDGNAACTKDTFYEIIWVTTDVSSKV